MSKITDGFEKRVATVSEYGACGPVENQFYDTEDVEELLAHARALEAMLRKHEHCVFNNNDIPSCPECGSECNEDHFPDCELARLLT